MILKVTLKMYEIKKNKVSAIISMAKVTVTVVIPSFRWQFITISSMGHQPWIVWDFFFESKICELYLPNQTSILSLSIQIVSQNIVNSRFVAQGS